MKQLQPALDQVAAWWAQYGGHVIVAAGVALALTLVASFLLARRRAGGTPRWIAAVAWVMAMGLSMDSMWVVATSKLHLAPALALVVFASGEAMMVNAMVHASEQYRRTTERNDSGEVVKPGHPGKHGRTVWLVAIAIGLVAGASGTNNIEHALRFLVPLGVANMWWDNLTSDGVTRPSGRWAWSPRRIAGRLGWLVDDADDDLTALDHKRRVAAMVRARVAVADGAWSAGLPVIGAKARLRRMARAADGRTISEVRAGVTRSLKVVDLTAPLDADLADLVAVESDQVVDVVEAMADQVAITTTATAVAADSLDTVTVDLTSAITHPFDQINGWAHERSDQVDQVEVSGHWEPSRYAQVGTAEWLDAVTLLRDLLDDELQPRDLCGLSGRGVFELTAILAPQVPALLPAQVVLFVADSLLVKSEQRPESSMPWGNLLSAAQPADEAAESTGPYSDAVLLATYGGALRGLRDQGKLTRYQVEQVTGAAKRQANRLLATLQAEADTEVTQP